LFEIGKQEDIQVENSEVQTETINTISQLYNTMDEQQARKQVTREAVADLANTITADLLIRKSLSRLRDIASGKAEAEAEAAQAAQAAEAAAVQEAEVPAGTAGEGEDYTSGEEASTPASPEEPTGSLESPPPDPTQTDLDSGDAAAKTEETEASPSEPDRDEEK
jgi:hypothetical protein